MMAAKGLNEKGANGPEDIWTPIPREDWHIPLDQFIYIGDGNSDLQIFGYLYRIRGIGIGVTFEKDTTKWPACDDMHSARAVENVAYANYEKGSELFKSLELSIASICNRINLRKFGNQTQSG